VNPAVRWSAIKELFQACLDVPAAEREEWLRTRTADPSMIAEVMQLLRQHESAGSFLDELPPAVARLRQPASAQLFEAGQLVADRYRILYLLGRGGMGEVYAAVDTELDERIAVKALTLAQQDAESAEQRFRRELQIARRITHPNVCRLFDFQRHKAAGAEFLLITMELIEGSTLGQYLRERAALRPEEARPIVDRVLDGLSTAHNAGIVHRDLKPANIMLTFAGERVERAVVMDFGLAIPAAQDGPGGQLTRTGQAIGTLDYMAPEQLQGAGATTRTDLYSVGLILYEMLTGERPFTGANPLAAAMKRLTEAVPAMGASIPSTWRRAISACLERTPEDRPASVNELRKLLDGGPTASLGSLRRRITRREVLVPAAASMSVMACFAAFLRYRERADAKASISLLLLNPVMNMTGNAQFNGATLLLRSQLAQSAHFQTVGEARVAELLQEMQRKPGGRIEPMVLREVALRAGAQMVAYGTLSPVGPELILDLRLELMGSRPDSVRHTWTEGFRATGASDLLRAIQESAIWIRQKSGEAETEIAEQDRSPADLTTGDWDALSRYEHARARLAAGDLGGAEVLFREAIQIDPQFVSAHRDLADMLVSEYRYAEGFQEYNRAITIASQRKLANWERYRLEAMYWDDAGDWEKAREIYHRWAVHYPKDYVPVYFEAAKLMGLARTDEAVAKFGQVLQLNDYRGAYDALGNIAILRGDKHGLAEAVANLERLREPERACSLKCRAAFVRGDPIAAASAASQLVSSKNADWKQRGLRLQAALQAEAGELEEAARGLSEVKSMADQTGDRGLAAVSRVGLGFLYWQLGRRAEAVQHATESARLDPNPQLLPRAAHVLSVCGETRGLKDLMVVVNSWPALPIFKAARAQVEGEWLLRRSDDNAALERFRQADQLYPREDPRDLLAAALMRAGKATEASDIFRKLATEPAAVWFHRPEELWPGLCRYSRQCLNKLLQKS